MADKRFDLHMHSVFSDGSCTVDELIERAQAVGLAGIAITDHDSLAQLTEVRERARAAEFPVLAGLEASCWNPDTGRKVHVLCYGLEATPTGDGPLEQIVHETLRARTANTLWQAWTIARAHVDFKGRQITMDDVVLTAGRSTGVYKQHVMQALTALPYLDLDYQRCYKHLFKNGGIAQHDISYPDARDVVRAMRDQGGHPVLAHPGQLDSWGFVPDLVKAGLEGIEAHHPDHDADDVARAHELAEKFGLFVTGGSDFHGRYGAPENVGCCSIMADEAGDRVAELFKEEKELS